MQTLYVDYCQRIQYMFPVPYTILSFFFFILISGIGDSGSVSWRIVLIFAVWSMLYSDAPSSSQHWATCFYRLSYYAIFIVKQMRKSQRDAISLCSSGLIYVLGKLLMCCHSIRNWCFAIWPKCSILYSTADHISCKSRVGCVVCAVWLQSSTFMRHCQFCHFVGLFHE